MLFRSIEPDSPTQRVGGQRLERFEPVEHSIPMLSLGNARGEDELRAWVDRMRSHLARESIDVADFTFVVEPKIDGLAVSLIQSNFTAIGSGVHVAEHGINLHNRGAAFTLERGLPNSFGPAKLPMHTLIPAMVLRDGRPSHVFGTMGGHAQAQIHLQVLHALLVDGADPHDAVSAPRWAFDPDSGEVRVEGRFAPDVVAQLESRGHRVRVVRDYDDAMGHAHCIEVLRDGVAVAADPRAESAALGL